jgi:DNA gyrase subunit A
MVQRTNAGGISQMGRATQGVRVMNLREGDEVSAVALVVESEANGDAAQEPLTLDATADEAAISEGTDGVIAADPGDSATLQPPEVEADDMPDSDVEE